MRPRPGTALAQRGLVGWPSGSPASPAARERHSWSNGRFVSDLRLATDVRGRRCPRGVRLPGRRISPTRERCHRCAGPPRRTGRFLSRCRGHRSAPENALRCQSRGRREEHREEGEDRRSLGRARSSFVGDAAAVPRQGEGRMRAAGPGSGCYAPPGVQAGRRCDSLHRNAFSTERRGPLRGL